jgi:hypothetical protein
LFQIDPLPSLTVDFTEFRGRNENFDRSYYWHPHRLRRIRTGNGADETRMVVQDQQPEQVTKRPGTPNASSPVLPWPVRDRVSRGQPTPDGHPGRPAAVPIAKAYKVGIVIVVPGVITIVLIDIIRTGWNHASDYHGGY